MAQAVVTRSKRGFTSKSEAAGKRALSSEAPAGPQAPQTRVSPRALGASGCGCAWCDIEGFSCDRLVITVHDGVTRERVDELNAEFGATVLFETNGLHGLQVRREAAPRTLRNTRRLGRTRSRAVDGIASCD